MKEQIRSMLIVGMSQAQTAQAVGCDESYVSQLMMDPDFAAEIAAGRAARTAKFIETDEEIDSAESMALKRVKLLIPMITKPVEAARVFATLNAAKRRAETNSVGSAQDSGDTVTLTLPKGVTAAVAIQISSDKQVVEVAGRSMTTMGAKTLAAKLESRKATDLLDAAVPQRLTLATNL